MTIKNIRSFEFKLGKLGLTLLIAGMGVLVFCAFVLGVTVGKDIDTYPDKIVRGIPRLITEGIGLVSPKGKSDGESKAQDKAALDLTFYDTLTKKGTTDTEFIGQEKREETSTPAVIVTPAPPALPATPAAPGTNLKPTMPVTPKATTARDASPKAGIAAPTVIPPKAGGTAPKPPVVGPTASANYSIQVVSYNERVKANQLQKKLQGMGYKVEVSEMDISGKGKWYRVMVNNYQTRKEAEKAAGNINKKVKGLNCIVRQGDKS